MIGDGAFLLRAKLRRQRSLVIVLQGHCMEPFLKEGDKALVEPVDVPELGDICLALSPSGTFGLHRVVKIMPETVLLKGDYEGKCEEVPKSNVIARAHAFRLEETDVWMDYGPPAKERLRVVDLSLGIVPEFNEDGDDRCRKREAIWRLNETLRKKMVEQALRELSAGLQMEEEQA